MRTNLGKIDRSLRVVIGCALIAYALRIGFPATGWNQLGWLGTIPLLTGFIGYCPVYALVEINTCTPGKRDESASPKG
ncbi:MAG: hypothetical protein JWM36_3692 [Hyphomicrobiales bacterium]|nr:hypothetical protein [Hyphomicrobiales bacterium]